MKNRFFIDTEFLEGGQTVYQWGLKTDYWLRIGAFLFIALGVYVYSLFHVFAAGFFIFPALILLGMSMSKTPNTIDLISIGIVGEHGDEYYAVSKDFNMREAWNRYQMKQVYGDARNIFPNGVKEYWIRENVLYPILCDLLIEEGIIVSYTKTTMADICNKYSFRTFKRLVKKHGKSNKQIAKDIVDFVDEEGKCRPATNINNPIEFYAWYADYDWVVFCWLFGNMIDLPTGFPMYCKDLKQISDVLYDKKRDEYFNACEEKGNEAAYFLNSLSDHLGYPKQINKHSALDDARWNLRLYKFLNTLKDETI